MQVRACVKGRVLRGGGRKLVLMLMVFGSAAVAVSDTACSDSDGVSELEGGSVDTSIDEG